MQSIKAERNDPTQCPCPRKSTCCDQFNLVLKLGGGQAVLCLSLVPGSMLTCGLEDVAPSHLEFWMPHSNPQCFHSPSSIAERPQLFLPHWGKTELNAGSLCGQAEAHGYCYLYDSVCFLSLPLTGKVSNLLGLVSPPRCSLTVL